MATLNLSFNQTEIAEAQKGGDFPILPAGVYIAQINRSEVKPTKAGTGTYLSLGFQILDGEFANRIIFQNITLSNPNQVAAQIGREQLAQLAGACGLLNVGDSQELHGIPMQIKVAIRKDKTGQYDDQNEIKKFMAYGNAPIAHASVTAPTTAQPTTSATPATAKRNPWERNAVA